MHQNAMSWWVKANEEVKSLQKEKNELVEKNLILEKVNQELEQKEKELEIEVEEFSAPNEYSPEYLLRALEELSDEV